MQKLLPFQGSLSFGVEAELKIVRKIFKFEFAVSSSSLLIGIPSASASWQAREIARQDSLWATTCFEAFVKPIGKEIYYEFNFSPKPAWNAYAFDGYRTPQPPTPSNDFAILAMAWNAETSMLTIEVQNDSAYSEFEVGLTTVAELRDQTIHYLATTHAEAKPDFHSAKSFKLRRGNKS